jgi:hypothetical protein
MIWTLYGRLSLPSFRCHLHGWTEENHMVKCTKAKVRTWDLAYRNHSFNQSTCDILQNAMIQNFKRHCGQTQTIILQNSFLWEWTLPYKFSGSYICLSHWLWNSVFATKAHQPGCCFKANLVPHWDIHRFGGCSGCFHSLQCTSQQWYLLHSTGTAATGKLASSAAWHYTYLQLAQFCLFYRQFGTDRQHYTYFKSIYSFKNTVYAFQYNLLEHCSHNISLLAMNSFDRSNSPLCSAISNKLNQCFHS